MQNLKYNPQSQHYLWIEQTLQEYTQQKPTEIMVAETLLAYRKLVQSGSHYGNDKNYVSRNYNYTFLTGKKIDTAKNGAAKRFMSAVTKEAIDPLIRDGVLDMSSRHYDMVKGKARTLSFTDEFRDFLLHRKEKLIDTKLEIDDTNSQRTQKETTRGQGWQTDKHLSRHNPVTLKTFEKLARSTFSIDWEAARSFDTAGMKAELVHNVAYVLSTLEDHSEEQHHKQINLSSSGRMWTDGGLMNLYRPLREKVVKAKAGHTLVDCDLASAQLVLLSEFLQSNFYDTVTTLKGSVWNYFGLDIDKKYMKTAIYAFCFGCSLDNIVDLVREKTGDDTFTRTHWNKMKAKLGDLTNKREFWFKHNPSSHIKKLIGTKNALGMSFQPESLDGNLPGQYLAFLMQGKEQLIMQSLIAYVVDDTLASFSYDGFLVEVPTEQIEETINRYQEFLSTNFPGHKLKTEVLKTHSILETVDVEQVDSLYSSPKTTPYNSLQSLTIEPTFYTHNTCSP